MAGACDENSWNDHLDGFEEFEDEPFTQVETVEYTLTNADYATIASLAANQALAGQDGAASLKAVGDLKRFSDAAPADKYVPAFLGSTGFPYFTLNDGSAVNLTYKQAANEPAGFAAAAAAQTVTISDEFYQNEVWDGENYILGFGPLQNAADYIPDFLEGMNHEPGDYVIVNYNQATQEPVFGGDVPAVPEVVYSETLTTEDGFNTFTIENVVKPEELDFVWSFGGENYGAKASAFKSGTNYASESWLVSPVIDLTGYAAPFFSFEEATNFFTDIEAAKKEATVWAREEGGQWQQLSGYAFPEKLSWTFVASGDIDLSAYAGKKMQIGFKFTSDTKSGTWEVKNITLTATPASRSAMSRGRVEVPMVVKNALYTFGENGSWSQAPSDYIVLSPADYTAMGQRYPNLPSAEPYLAKWLDMNYGFAAADDVKYIVWTKYADGKSSNQCSAYRYDGTQWQAYDFVEEKSAQFVRNAGKWMYDPNVTITLPAGKSIEISTKYYQACVDWVFENICKPLGDTNIKSGAFYVSKYGNNEYYSGTSAYQGNVDLRGSAAATQYPAGYEGMTDQEITELEKKRFMEETMPGALGMLHADAEPIEGLEVLYTINFYAYEYDEVEKKNLTNPYTAVFKVVGKGKFAPVSCTWGYKAE